MQTHQTASFLIFSFLTPKPMYDTIWWPSTVRYDLTVLFCTIQSCDDCWYDHYLRATHTTILSIRGVTIPSYLVSSATDSTRQSAVVFKPVLVPTSDVTIRSDYTTYADTSDCLVSFYFLNPIHHSPCTIRSGEGISVTSCTIRSGGLFLYDINLRATHTTMPSTRGVTIHISLVSSTTGLFTVTRSSIKPVPVAHSDLKSEFLCQSSLSHAEPADPSNPLYAWDNSHTLSPRIILTATVLAL